MRKDFYKAILVIFLSAFSQIVFGQCPTIAGTAFSIDPAECIGGNEGRIIVTITGLDKGSTFNLFSGSSGTSAIAGVTYIPAGGAIAAGAVRILTITGVQANTYNIRYQRGGCNFTGGSNPNPLLTPINVTGPAPANTGAVSNICLSTGAQFLSGSDPSSPNISRGFVGTWTLTPTVSGIFSDIHDQGATLSNLTTTGTFTLTWSVSIAGCNSSSLTTSSVNFDVVKDPDVTSTLTGNVCSGSTYNYTITSTIIGSSMPLIPTFSWSRPVISGISNAANSATTSTINETLINTISLPVDVLYTLQAITPDISGLGDICSGPFSVLTVTVFPAPVANTVVGDNFTYCSNSLTNISITSNVIGTQFTWTTSVTSGFVNGQTSGSGSLINQTLTGSGTMVYIVSPIVGTTSCPGVPLLIPVTVNPLPTITGLSVPAICSGDNSNITWSVTPVAPSVFLWTASYPAGLSGAVSGSTSSINVPITNTTTNTLTGTFTITPTVSGTGCVGPSTTVSQIVYPLPLVTSTTPGAICSGTAFVRALTSNIPVSGFTIIRLANPNVLETAVTATFSGNSINHTLTGTTGNVEVVQYTIIPISSTNCTGLGVTFNVTVNPTPSITGFTLTSICSGFSTNIVPNTFPATGSVFTWTAAVQSGSASGFSNQVTTSTGPIVQTLNGNGVVRYTVTPNINGCIGLSKTVDQLINPSPTFTGIAIPVTLCLGASSTLSVSGTLNYSWSPSGTLSAATGNPVIATPVAFGVNTYNVTGLNTITGCQFTTSVSVTVVNPTTPGIIFSGDNQIFCAGNTIPGITVTATSGIIGLYENGALVASGASPLNQAANTAIGNHAYTANVTLTGCPSPMSAAVNYTVAGVPTISGTNASICGLNPVNLTVSSNAASFVWTLSASTTASATITPVAFGNNLITVTGTLGTCSKSIVITVTAFAIPTVAGSNVTVCGLIGTTLTVAGNGTSYLWSNGSVGTTSGIIIPSSFGNSSFTVTATSAICSSTATLVITALPNATISGTNTSICGLNPVNLTVNSNATSFIWTGNASTTASATITPISFGNTIVTVTGTLGSCSASTVVTITAFAVPTVAGNNITICGLSAVTLTIAGNATSYAWSNGSVGTTSGVITPGSFGTSSFTVTATSAICSSTATLDIIALPPPTVSGSNLTVCGLTAATLTVSGNAASYAWSNGGSGTSISAVPAVLGNTLFTVTATSGLCSSTATLTVTSIATPTITGTNSATICSGLSTTLTVTGAANYSWSTGATTSSISVSPTATTSFTVSGFSAGCNSNALIIPVTVNPIPTITGANPPAICQGTSAVLTVSGATQYSWSPATFLNTTTGSTVISTPTTTVSYIVTATTSGCVTTQTITVVVNTISPSPTPASPQNYCLNASAAPLATGVVTNPNWYNVSIGGTSLGISFTPSVTAVGTQFYWLSQNSNGCESARVRVTVNVNSGPTLTGANIYTTCAGQDLELSVNGAISYIWAPLSSSITVTGNSAIVNLTSSQTYSITGMNASGCTSVKVVTVTINALPVIGITGNTTICSGMNTSLLASGANTYLWQPGTISFNPLLLFGLASTTTYTVTGTNTTTQCSNDASITVVVNPSVSVPTVPSGPISFCGPSLAPSSYTSTISNATAIGWNISAGTSIVDNFGNVTWDPNYTGTAVISVTGYGCSGPVTNSLSVAIFNIPTITGISSTDPSNCAVSDGSMTVTGTGNGPFDYSDAYSNNSTGIFTGLSSGTPYPIQLTDVNGCAVNGPAQILTVSGQPASPSITAGGSYGVCSTIPTIDVDAGTVTGIIGIYNGLPLIDANMVASIAGSSLSYQPTTIPGTYNFYANITVAGCVSSPAGPSTVIVDAPIAALSVTSPLNYCESDPAPTPFTTVNNAGTEEWYNSSMTYIGQSGASTTVPDVSTPGVFDYYVFDRDGYGCEGLVTTVSVTITSASMAPCSCNSFSYDMAETFDIPICNNEFKEYVNPIVITGGAQPYTVRLLDPLSTVAGNVVTFNGINSLSYNISITGKNLTNTIIYANYSVAGVYDANGCVATANSGTKFAFNHFPSPTIIGINQPAPVCLGTFVDITTRSQGEIPTISGSSLLSYHDTFADANLPTPTGVLPNPTAISTPGTYFYRFADDPYSLGNTCWAIAPISVTSTLSASAQFIPGNNIGSKCEGSLSSFVLPISVSGANVNGVELLQNGANPILFMGLTPDVNNFVTVTVNPSFTTIYTIGQVFGSTCSGMGVGIVAQITVNPTPSLVGTNLVNGSCGQSIDLTTVLSDVNSTTGITTYWTDAAATSSLSNPSAVSVSGVYYVKKQSVPGCSDIQPVQLIFSSSPTANIVGSTSICGGNPTPINILFGGGNGTYTFTYTDGTTSVTTTTSSTIYTTIQNPTTTTTYTLVSVSDGTGCVGSVNGVAMISMLPVISCSGCTLPTIPVLSLTQVSVSGITASWTNSGATYYQFDLANDAGFTSFVPAFSGITTTGLSFSTATGLSAGVYFGRVIAFNACGSVAGMNTITISSSLPLFATTILGTQTIPVGGFAVLTVILSGTGPFTNIQIDYGDPFNTIYRPSAAGTFTLTVNPSIPTTYVVSGYSDGGNTNSGPGISATVTPISPQTPTVVLSAPYTASCASGGFLFDANVSGLGGGTANYTWLVNGSVSGQSTNTATISLSGISTGDIVSVLVSVTGGNVTSTTATSNIISPTITNQIASLSYLPVSCIGGTDGAILISISSANAGRSFSYFMNTITGTISGNGIINNVTPALFVLTIQDNLNPACTQILTGNPGLSDFQVIKSSVNPSCAGNDGSMTIGVASSVYSNYNVTIKGISLVDTTIILSNLTTSSSLLAVHSTLVKKLKYGIYSTQFEYGTCVSGEFIDTLTGAQPPIADLGLDSMNVCQYQQFTLTTVGLSGGSYSWFRNDTLLAQIPSNSITLVADRSAKYTVNVPGNNGCVASDFIKINVSKLSMKLVSTQYSNANSVNVKWNLFNTNGFPGDSVFIQRRDFTPFIGPWAVVGSVLKSDSIFVNTSVPTDQIIYQYRVVGTRNNICVSNEHSDILLKGTNDESISSVSLFWNSYKTWKSGIKEYQVWLKTDNDPKDSLVYNGLDTTLFISNTTKGFNQYYRVLAISNDPQLNDSIASWSNPLKLHFSREVIRYNAFSPNGDGNNDFFRIKNIESYPNSEITILNRWGGRVYYAKPYVGQWNGDGCTDGTYFYLLDLGNGTSVIKDYVLLQR